MKGFEYQTYQIEAFNVKPDPYSENDLSENEKKYIDLAVETLRNQMIFTLASKEDYGQNEQEAIQQWDEGLIHLLHGGR